MKTFVVLIDEGAHTELVIINAVDFGTAESLAYESGYEEYESIMELDTATPGIVFELWRWRHEHSCQFRFGHRDIATPGIVFDSSNA